MAIVDLTEDLRVANETPESIKARLLADTNAGVDPNDPAYADTIPGSMWDDIEGAGCLEWDRLYDRLNQAAAAAIPATSWGAFLDAWAVSLDLERKDAAFAGGTVTFTGLAATVIAVDNPVSTPQTSSDTEPQTYQTTAGGAIPVAGTLDLPVIAVVAGSTGNVPANTVTINDGGTAAVTNAAGMTGGADVETDDALRTRILRKLSGAGGGGNVDDYVNWALNYPGVGFVTVQANTPVVGHVTVLITDINNDPMPAFAVDGLKAQLDPSATTSQGRGLAPVGATAPVDTPVSVAVPVVAEVTLEPGFTLDGAAGTRAVGDEIEASLRRYIDTLPVGGDVVRTKVIAAIVDVVGVADVDTATLSINAATVGDMAVGATEVASMSTATITAP